MGLFTTFHCGHTKDGLPNEGYGFDFRDETEKRANPVDDGCGGSSTEDHIRLPDEKVKILWKKTAADAKNNTEIRQFTHRFMMANYPESRGVKILGGQTYAGVTTEKNIVGKISAALFNVYNMDESLQLAGDCMTGEVYDAMCELFAGTIHTGGQPKGPFKKKCTNAYSGYSSILYIGGVYVKTDERGHGLGLEIVRALIESVQVYNEDHGGCDVVILCPAGEPHPGKAAWPYVFDAISNHFETMGFQRCGGQNRRSGQSLYMFLETDNHDLTLKEPIRVTSTSSTTILAAPTPSSSSSLAAGMTNSLESVTAEPTLLTTASSAVPTPSTTTSSNTIKAVAALATAADGAAAAALPATTTVPAVRVKKEEKPSAKRCKME